MTVKTVQSPRVSDIWQSPADFAFLNAFRINDALGLSKAFIKIRFGATVTSPWKPIDFRVAIAFKKRSLVFMV